MGSFFDGVWGFVSDQVHEAAAQQIADVARSEGLQSADSVSIELEPTDDGVEIDVERVRRRANEILAGL
ncbi:hypothetical protein C1N74_11585 [Microbacterium sp. SGAir0570]|uniref:hypothetical protein n=1 Tax=Microbacterium sp. SGAir0570 TaxID=2070348 RepID=UPI000DF7B632|nr:hypothetical protein [Microbacterium sp. SGAir0570]QCR40988.1 hypothetical protein C1N74_11585 [Microbacterium sp. SGAir0570]